MVAGSTGAEPCSRAGPGIRAGHARNTQQRTAYSRAVRAGLSRSPRSGVGPAGEEEREAGDVTRTTRFSGQRTREAHVKSGPQGRAEKGAMRRTRRGRVGWDRRRAAEGKWAETGPASRRLSRSSVPERTFVLPLLRRGRTVSVFSKIPWVIRKQFTFRGVCSLETEWETRAILRSLGIMMSQPRDSRQCWRQHFAAGGAPRNGL